MTPAWKGAMAAAAVLFGLTTSVQAAQELDRPTREKTASSEEIQEALELYVNQLPKMEPVKGLQPIKPSDYTITVYKPKVCGCCSGWIRHMKKAGFNVKVKSVFSLNSVEPRQIVPEYLHACHTSEVDGYVLEGHVPPEDIIRLLTEQLEVAGLAVPGMPWGSPGMHKEGVKIDYDVVALGKDGQQAVYTSYEDE